MTAEPAVELESVRNFWNENPVAAEGIAETLGSALFFKSFDAIREADDCEPYEYSNLIHSYSDSAGKRVLDIGCGNGYVLSRYARHGALVHGVDLTDTAIELCRKRFAIEGLAGSFETIDGQRLPFPDSCFDIVCSMGVLHHMSNPRPLVDEIHRILKPGGRMIAMLYHRYSYKYMVLFRLKRLFDPRYRGKSQQEALNMNDGPACPLAMVYSKRKARRLFSRFENHAFRLNQLTYRQLFLLPPLIRLAKRILPGQSDTWIARHLGWNLYITARKASY